MPHPADEAQLRIQWSEKDIGHLNRLLRFVSGPKRNPVVCERDPKTLQPVYRLAADPAIPPEVGLLAGSIVDGLRSALEYLVYALVKNNGGTPTDDTGFPITKTFSNPLDRHSSFARKVNGIRQEAIDFISGLKPYNGGNGALWRLHSLSNIHKHRLIVPVAACATNINGYQHLVATNPGSGNFDRMARMFTDADFYTDLRQLTFPLKKGSVVFMDTPNAKIDDDFQLTTTVAFNESRISEGEPVERVIGGLLKQVRYITYKLVPLFK